MKSLHGYLLLILGLSTAAALRTAETQPATGATPPTDASQTDATPAATEPAGENAQDGRVEATRIHRDRDSDNDVPFGHQRLAKGHRTETIVSLFGSSHIEGEVSEDAVSVFGNTSITRDGKIGGDAVAVLGRLDSEGEIGADAVSVIGGLAINGPVGGDAVAVLGGLRLGPDAVINGDLVVVGGGLIKDPKAIVRGKEVHLPIIGNLSHLDGITAWLAQCVFLGRPLGFGPNLGWAWIVAFSFLAFYFVLALIFAGPVDRCVNTFESAPGYSLVASVLTVLLTPVAIVLLTLSMIGILLIPFFGTALLFANLFGKAVILVWIGRQITRLFGSGKTYPAIALLIGGLVVMLLYTVPFAGFLIYKLLTWLGLGIVVYTLVLYAKRNKPAVVGAASSGGVPVAAPVVPPAQPSPAPQMAASDTMAGARSVASPASQGPAVSDPWIPAPVAPPVEATPASSGAAFSQVPPPTSSGFFSEASTPFAGVVPPSFTPPPAAPLPEQQPSPPAYASPPPLPRPPLGSVPMVPASTLPRATFFIRLGALLIDVILVGIIVAFMSDFLPRFMRFNGGIGSVLIALAIYGGIMWKTKGTTIGGIVCGLKVVRTDDREIDWATAWVRALACFLSLVVVGLGFIWIAIDDEKQSWHDKIAGTAVVRMPKGVSLV